MEVRATKYRAVFWYHGHLWKLMWGVEGYEGSRITRPAAPKAVIVPYSFFCHKNLTPCCDHQLTNRRVREKRFEVKRRLFLHLRECPRIHYLSTCHMQGTVLDSEAAAATSRPAVLHKSRFW